MKQSSRHSPSEDVHFTTKENEMKRSEVEISFDNEGRTYIMKLISWQRS